MRAVEPGRADLLNWSLILLLVLGLAGGAYGALIAVSIVASLVAAACVMFKVWLTYIKYYKDLKLDEAFYSDPWLD